MNKTNLRVEKTQENVRPPTDQTVGRRIFKTNKRIRQTKGEIHCHYPRREELRFMFLT